MFMSHLSACGFVLRARRIGDVKTERKHERPSPASVEKPPRARRRIKTEPGAGPDDLDDAEDPEVFNLDRLVRLEDQMVEEAASKSGRCPVQTLAKADKKKAREAQDRTRGFDICRHLKGFRGLELVCGIPKPKNPLNLRVPRRESETRSPNTRYAPQCSCRDELTACANLHEGCGPGATIVTIRC